MPERAVLVIRRRRPIGEPDAAEPGSTPGFTVLHGTNGAGRPLQSLAELGLSFPTVVQSTHDPAVTVEQIDRLDVGQRFATVILGSHLVNGPDADVRRAWLRAAARHLDGDADLLVEHHPLDWAETAADERAVPGGDLGMIDVRRDPPFVSATSVFDIGGHVVRQPFTARVLSEEELAAELEATGLSVRRRLSPTWLVAGAG
ncbi:MAG TPA: hypothetical protein VJS87_02885 [Solirubrobacterales bacterium]|nr:hypothetical protein [Solirubrobacterales bacterium]